MIGKYACYDIYNIKDLKEFLKSDHCIICYHIIDSTKKMNIDIDSFMIKNRNDYRVLLFLVTYCIKYSYYKYNQVALSFLKNCNPENDDVLYYLQYKYATDVLLLKGKAKTPFEKTVDELESYVKNNTIYLPDISTDEGIKKVDKSGFVYGIGPQIKKLYENNSDIKKNNYDKVIELYSIGRKYGDRRMTRWLISYYTYPYIEHINYIEAYNCFLEGYQDIINDDKDDSINNPYSPVIDLFFVFLNKKDPRAFVIAEKIRHIKSFSQHNYHLLLEAASYFEGVGTNPDYDKAFKLLSQIIEGDIDKNKFVRSSAMYYIGCAYENGIGGYHQDYNKAIACYNMVLDNLYCMAIYNISRIYSNLQMYDKIIEVTLNVLEKNHQNQYVPGFNEISQLVGSMYHLGVGVYKDLEKAISIYSKCITSGDCMNNLGLLYEHELNDLESAFKAYQKSSFNDNPAGCYNLGIAYIEGKGTDVNQDMGITFIRKAGSLGYQLAKDYLNNLYNDFGDFDI